MHAPQRMLPRSVRVASVAQGCEQSLKCGFTPRVQHALLGANAEYDFLDAAKGSRLRTETGAGELQSAPAERDLQGSSEFVLIGRPAHFPGRWRAPIPFAADFELRGTRLAQPLYRQSQLPIFHLRVEHAPHGISLSRPQVQKALVVFPG